MRDYPLRLSAEMSESMSRTGKSEGMCRGYGDNRGVEERRGEVKRTTGTDPGDSRAFGKGDKGELVKARSTGDSQSPRDIGKAGGEPTSQGA